MAPGFRFHIAFARSVTSDRYWRGAGVTGSDAGAGIAGRGEVAPEPVVLAGGVTLRIGARQSTSRQWSWIGAAAHVPPLLASVMYFTAIDNAGLGGMVIGSMVMHVVWSSIEVIAALSKSPAAQQSAVEAH